MIDADPNQPLISWSGLKPLPPRISVVADQSAETIIDTIEDARAKADFVIVDLEGTATDRIGFAIARSDLVLIPLQASVLDATEAVKSIKLIRQMSRVAGREIPYRLFFSRIAAAIRERTAKDIEGVIAESVLNPTLSENQHIISVLSSRSDDERDQAQDRLAAQVLVPFGDHRDGQGRASRRDG